MSAVRPDGAAGAEVGTGYHVPHEGGHAGDAAVVEKDVREDGVVHGARQHAAEGAGVDAALVEPVAGAAHAVRAAGEPPVDEQRLAEARGRRAVRKGKWQGDELARRIGVYAEPLVQLLPLGGLARRLDASGQPPCGAKERSRAG